MRQVRGYNNKYCVRTRMFNKNITQDNDDYDTFKLYGICIVVYKWQ